VTQLRHLIPEDAVDELWSVKDSLRRQQQLLSSNPLEMHKTKFVSYLKVRVAAEYTALQEAGMAEDEAYAEVAQRAKMLVTEWRAKAIEKKRKQKEHDKLQERYRNYRAHGQDVGK
jgi:hypothetical protein